MKKNTDGNTMVSIFYKGIENHQYFNTKVTFKNSFKYAVWIILYFFTQRKKPTNNESAIIVYGGIHEKIFSNENFDLIYHGQSLKKVSHLLNRRNLLSEVSIFRRVIYLLSSVMEFFKYKINFNLLFYWVDFYIINNFIKENNIKKLKIAGHYDRYATWITELAEKNNIEMIINQHGALAKIDLPHKVFCSRFIAFNETEKNFMSRYVIKNQNCSYNLNQFVSYVNFKTLEKENDEILIGIASQDLCTNETIEIIKRIYELMRDKKIRLLLYPHPRESLKKFRALQTVYPSLEVYKYDRHDNISILITFYSSIVYDYIYQGLYPKIFCMPPKDIEMGFFSLSEVEVLNDINEIKQYL